MKNSFDNKSMFRQPSNISVCALLGSTHQSNQIDYNWAETITQ